MAHFQLWIPDRTAADPQYLIDVGCADLVEHAQFMTLAEGPSGGPGVLVAWPVGPDKRQQYAPAEQTWRPAVPRGGWPAGRYHVGYWTASPPTPADLKRPYPYRGTEQTLGGAVWLLPLEAELPRDCVLADDGSWKFERQRRFADFGATVEALKTRWFEEMRAGPDDKFDRPVLRTEVLDLLLDALRLNYRLVPELVNVLRLFDTESLLAPFEAIVA